MRARGLTKTFGDFLAVDGIDVEVHKGEAFGFLGPNGAGKSSTMRMIGCVSPLSGGRLSIRLRTATAGTNDGRTPQSRPEVSVASSQDQRIGRPFLFLQLRGQLEPVHKHRLQHWAQRNNCGW